jgi:hypothetical protein
MSAYRKYDPMEGPATTTDSPSRYCRQGDIKTLDGTGTTTDVTFADEGLWDMVGTGYNVLLSPFAAQTVQPYVSARTATGFTITHDSGSTDQIGWEVIGQAKPTR